VGQGTPPDAIALAASPWRQSVYCRAGGHSSGNGGRRITASTLSVLRENLVRAATFGVTSGGANVGLVRGGGVGALAERPSTASGASLLCLLESVHHRASSYSVPPGPGRPGSVHHFGRENREGESLGHVGANCDGHARNGERTENPPRVIHSRNTLALLRI